MSDRLPQGADLPNIIATIRRFADRLEHDGWEALTATHCADEPERPDTAGPVTRGLGSSTVGTAALDDSWGRAASSSCVRRG